MKNAEILYILPCDDIRQEVSGKLICIGVYGDNIGLASFPATFKLTFLVGFSTPGPGAYTLDFTLMHSEDGRIGNVRMDFEAEEKVDRSATALPPMPVQIKSPGEITVILNGKDSILRIPVILYDGQTPSG